MVTVAAADKKFNATITEGNLIAPVRKIGRRLDQVFFDARN